MTPEVIREEAVRNHYAARVAGVRDERSEVITHIRRRHREELIEFHQRQLTEIEMAEAPFLAMIIELNAERDAALARNIPVPPSETATP